VNHTGRKAPSLAGRSAGVSQSHTAADAAASVPDAPTRLRITWALAPLKASARDAPPPDKQQHSTSLKTRLCFCIVTLSTGGRQFNTRVTATSFFYSVGSIVTAAMLGVYYATAYQPF